MLFKVATQATAATKAIVLSGAEGVPGSAEGDGFGMDSDIFQPSWDLRVENTSSEDPFFIFHMHFFVVFFIFQQLSFTLRYPDPLVSLRVLSIPPLVTSPPLRCPDCQVLFQQPP
ncbi:hypothetical protein D9758_010308 [Tetrapyrgos nigripes]|uniref:Uncharacterized protein n=1 Tax=Tetrapyrgos nigripes TaxID=182062 RepID=A0A8H5GAA4_9AGAR|nr:hypothetical protein D9758_010308 [Tetrapyrgos nigripes]